MISYNLILNKRIWIYIAIAVFSVFLSFIPVAKHDYLAYLEQWDVIINKGIPSIKTGNSYGIVFNLFAYVSNVPFFSFPRIIFIFIYLIASYETWLFSKKKLKRGSNLVSLILLFNPIFLIFGIKLGNNETFLVGITALVILSYIQDKKSISGILFAIGISFKFSPIFILPFFVFNQFTQNKKFIISIVLSSIFIFTSGYLVWGNSIFEPFLIGINRPSKLLSIFRFIRSDSNPLRIIGIINIDYLSLAFVLSVVAINYILFLKYKLDYLLMAFLTFLGVIMLYKVGHIQFYLLLLYLQIIVFIEHGKEIKKDIVLLVSSIVFWIFIFITTISYYYFDFFLGDFIILRDYLGLFTFVFQVILYTFLLKFIFNINREKTQKTID